MPDPEAVMKRYPHQLSGGMLQRCVIAMALMTDPSLLIMDEPTTALDVTTQAVVLDLVAELKREFDSAILYITHDLGVITRICDRVGVMYAGEFMEQAHCGSSSSGRCTLHPRSPGLRAALRPDAAEALPGHDPRLDPAHGRAAAGLHLRAPLQVLRGRMHGGATTAPRSLAGHPRRACRWRVVPPPAEYLRAATEALAPCVRPSACGRGARRGRRGLKCPLREAPKGAHPRRRRHGSRRCASARRSASSVRAAAARPPWLAPSSGSRRRPAASSGCTARRCSRAPASGRAPPSKRSRWCSRTRTPR